MIIYETDLDSYITMSKIKFNMCVELLLIFVKNKNIYFYFFTKTNLLNVLAMQDYVKEFLFL